MCTERIIMNLEITIQKILKGDKESFRFIIREYSSPVRAFVARRVFQADIVDDIIQDIFLSAFEKLSQYDDTHTFITWLFAIASNRIKMHFRSSNRRESAYERFTKIIEKRIFPKKVEEEDDKIILLKKCLDKIPERMHQFIKQRYFNNEQVKLIAQLNDMNEDAVSALLYRGRKKIADCMKG